MHHQIISIIIDLTLMD